jgi:hypothetical protein
LGNKWLIDNKFDFDAFNECLSKHAVVAEGPLASFRRMEVYQHLISLAEEICKRFKHPDSDLEPYQLARACYTVFNPIKEWPVHWNAKPEPWTKNKFLEKLNITDMSPLTAFSETKIEAFSWFVGVMTSCMKEMNAWNPPEIEEIPLEE